jgi:acetoin utilization deacetylase AcuC-like enzyme
METVYTLNPHHHLHTKGGHPENKRRLEAVAEMFEKTGISHDLYDATYEPAPYEALELVHFKNYLDELRVISERGGGELDQDTYATANSWVVACEAAGGLLAITQNVIEDDIDNGYGLLRPPGHHATRDHAMGFCLVNNVAVATEWARQELGLERALILDFDVHHGNGTQDIFYEDQDVMYCSLHQSPLFPGTGVADEIGAGSGEWSTVNVPLPEGTGDEGYRLAMREMIEPIVERFDPDCLFVSAGYDAHWKDPLAGMNLTVKGFTDLTYILMEWADRFCDDRLVLALEGGYNTDVLPACVRATIERLQDPTAEIHDPFGTPSQFDTPVEGLIEDLRALHGLP